MFSVGQRVWHRDGQRSGKVLECEAGRVFIEQDNGAELDFPAKDLTATPPANARPPSPGPASGGRSPAPWDAGAPSGQGGYVMPNRTLVAGDITPEHDQVLRIIPPRTLQAIAALYDRRPGASKFGALDTAARLNVIAEITNVPYRTMRGHRDRPGELGLLMGKGLADSQRAAQEAPQKGLQKPGR